MCACGCASACACVCACVRVCACGCASVLVFARWPAWARCMLATGAEVHERVRSCVSIRAR
eukprot:951655-Alexandrium_andersonii.AAC.1